MARTWVTGLPSTFCRKKIFRQKIARPCRYFPRYVKHSSPRPSSPLAVKAAGFDATQKGSTTPGIVLVWRPTSCFSQWIPFRVPSTILPYNTQNNAPSAANFPSGYSPKSSLEGTHVRKWCSVGNISSKYFQMTRRSGVRLSSFFRKPAVNFTRGDVVCCLGCYTVRIRARKLYSRRNKSVFLLTTIRRVPGNPAL